MMVKRISRAIGRPRQGRPARPPETLRSNRVVTFVTDAEFEQLETMAWQEERSLSAVVYRILSAHLKRQGKRPDVVTPGREPLSAPLPAA